MTRPIVRRYTDSGSVEGILGGVVIAGLLVGGYLFAWDVVYAGTDSPWRIGRFGVDVMFLGGGLNVGFLLVPGFVVSTVVTLLRRRGASAARGAGDRRTLLSLVTVPLLIGVVIGLSFSILPLSELLSSPSPGALGDLVLFLVLSLPFIAIQVVYMAIIIGISVAAGYLFASSSAVVLGIWRRGKIDR